MNDFILDAAGEALIKEFEGFSLTPYKDECGIPTIGWGHIQNVTMASPALTMEDAEKFFKLDLYPTEESVKKYVTIPINQNEYNALVSFSFNEGVRKFLTSSLLTKLNHGDRPGAGKEFLRWVYYRNPVTGDMEISKGLQSRRSAEMALFLTPVFFLTPV